MARPVKVIVSFILGCLGVFFIASAILLYIFLEPSRYKAQISQAFYQKTQRQLSLKDASLSLFPWLGVQLKGVQISNPPGFSAQQPFATIHEIDLKVRVIPLFSGHLEFGKVLIKDPDIKLIKNSAGANWQNWSRGSSVNATSKAVNQPGQSPKPSATHFYFDSVNLPSIAIEDARIQMQNGSQTNAMVVSGVLNFKASLATSGTTTQNWLSHLSGKGSVKVTEGVLYGIDLNYWVGHAMSLINQTGFTGTNSNKTSFDKLTASFSINKGVVSNSDMKLSGSTVNAAGKGQINLVQNTISYRVITTASSNDSLQIPIVVSGSLNDPSIQPDIGPLVKNVVKTTITKQLENVAGPNGKAIGEAVGGLLDTLTGGNK